MQLNRAFFKPALRNVSEITKKVSTYGFFSEKVGDFI